MRLFVAVPMEGEMKNALRGVQNELRRRGVEGNYTRPENLHLTLAFIGEYPDAERVLDVMEGVCFKPFSLVPDGLGSFGELWWAGLSAGGETETLARRLRRALGEAAVPFDRKSFHPHITLIRQPRFRGDPRIDTIRIPRAEMRVEKISLMASTRGKSGMIYTELGFVPARDES